MTLTLEDPKAEHAAYAIVYGLVMLLGLPLNAVALWILIRRHRLKSSSAVFMINLALSDLLLALSLPLRVYFHVTQTWPLSWSCAWITMPFRNNLRASVIFITFISVDRLLAVVYPLRSRHLRTTTNTWKACGLVWICLIAVNIPECVKFSEESQLCNVTTCFTFNDCKRSEVPVYVQSSFVFILLAVNVVSTSMVFWKLRHLSDSRQVTDNKINVMLIFAMNLFMFVVFFLPVSLVMIVDRPLALRTVCLASVNCCFDPLLYYFSLDSFWKKKDNLETSTL